jgi:hypothetical protein
MEIPKIVKEALQEALHESDSFKAGAIINQSEEYLPKSPVPEPVSTTRTFSIPLNISSERAAKLFTADRVKLKNQKQNT